MTPRTRLRVLSKRSPTTAAAKTATPSSNQRVIEPSNNAAAQADHASTATAPPRAPSTVFPGLTAGANLRWPNRRPVKYAPVSASATAARSQAICHAPTESPCDPVAAFTTTSASHAPPRATTPPASATGLARNSGTLAG